MSINLIVWPMLEPGHWTRDVREASQVDKNKGRHYACKYRPSQKIGSVLDRELLNISGQMGDAMAEERGSP